MIFTAAYGWTVERIGIPAAARVVPAGAADQRHRHVDLPAKLSCSCLQGARVKTMQPIVSGGVVR